MNIIAEIGTAHGGDLEKAQRLIDAAAEAGADTAKFQIVFAREIIHPLTGSVPLPGGDIPLFKVFESLERDSNFYSGLKEYTEASGMEFMATPFGFESAAILKTLSPERIKIASPELNHFSLLKEVSGWQLPLILSTGVSRREDILRALNVLDLQGIEKSLVTLFHCITSYPAPEEEYNLRILETFRKEFGVASGVSDHSLDPVLVPLVSLAMGGSAVEKHIGLSRKEQGLDDPIALEPEDFRLMVKTLRQAEETSPEDILKEARSRYGTARVESVLGDGIKELAPSERAHYGRTNRSVHALKDLSPGDAVSEDNAAVLRTEKVLSPGMDPAYWDIIQGKTLCTAVEAGQGIMLSDIKDSDSISRPY